MRHEGDPQVQRNHYDKIPTMTYYMWGALQKKSRNVGYLGIGAGDFYSIGFYALITLFLMNIGTYLYAEENLKWFEFLIMILEVIKVGKIGILNISDLIC